MDGQRDENFWLGEMGDLFKRKFFVQSGTEDCQIRGRIGVNRERFDRPFDSSDPFDLRVRRLYV